jgi:tRNA threonylcarbamoyladenosine biosynthesis protein TsaE
MRRILSRSAEETEAAGRSFAGRLRPGDVVALTGTLGSGKTRFVAGVCEGLGVPTHVTSPSFTLINEYPAAFGLVAHIDMYRINSMKEVADLGVEEYFNSRCICLIEWAETVLDILPPAHFHVSFSHGGSESERDIQIEGPREPLE